MLEVAAGLLFDRNNKLLIYLRDDKPTIPFPDHWDLFGGFVEDGETPEEALEREVMEEIGVTLTHYKKWRVFDCLTGDAKPNIKHVYVAHLDVLPENLTLLDCGQRIASISLDERHAYKFGSMHPHILNEYAEFLQR